jgi:hypothetical protein
MPSYVQIPAEAQIQPDALCSAVACRLPPALLWVHEAVSWFPTASHRLHACYIAAYNLPDNTASQHLDG